MVSEVYFKVVDQGEGMKRLAEIVISLFNDAGLDACIDKNDLTAIKMHFGEEGNDTHIPPDLVRPVVEEIKKERENLFSRTHVFSIEVSGIMRSIITFWLMTMVLQLRMWEPLL